MICSKRKSGASEEGLHLADVCCFAVDQLLGQIFDLAVMVGPLVHILQPLYHAAGIAKNHHVRNFGVGISIAELHSGHHVGHQSLSGLQFRQFPASLGSQSVGLAFNGIVLLELGFQRFPQAGSHGGIENAPDPYLPHLRGF